MICACTTGHVRLPFSTIYSPLYHDLGTLGGAPVRQILLSPSANRVHTPKSANSAAAPTEYASLSRTSKDVLYPTLVLGEDAPCVVPLDRRGRSWTSPSTYTVPEAPIQHKHLAVTVPAPRVPHSLPAPGTVRAAGDRKRQN
jgi:hypothetical protein